MEITKKKVIYGKQIKCILRTTKDPVFSYLIPLICDEKICFELNEKNVKIEHIVETIREMLEDPIVSTFLFPILFMNGLNNQLFISKIEIALKDEHVQQETYRQLELKITL